jgi:hypothetical protein
LSLFFACPLSTLYLQLDLLSPLPSCDPLSISFILTAPSQVSTHLLQSFPRPSSHWIPDFSTFKVDPQQIFSSPLPFLSPIAQQF